jgi:uncharacterized protein YjbI with pentapeptide repeats
LASPVRLAARSPQAPELPPSLEPGEVSSFSHDESHAEIELADVALCDQHAKGLALQTVRLRKVDLSGSRLDHLSLIDGTLEGCSLANVQSPSAELARVAITACRLTGMALPQAKLRDVTIRDSRVDLASFGVAQLTRVTFEDCLLAQTDFLDAQLEDVRFHGCDLTGADFRGARLRRCEFRRSDLTDLQGVESLRGAALEWSEIVALAGVWATALGIETLD